ncbi:hypothetical protein MP638_005557 [Amoeboaphelidium occidentale]|nr:hypothetical protein MP638_005557 [Amoeboaphelidium occidentale]
MSPIAESGKIKMCIKQAFFQILSGIWLPVMASDVNIPEDISQSSAVTKKRQLEDVEKEEYEETEDQSVFTVKSGIMTFLKDTDLKKPILESSAVTKKRQLEDVEKEEYEETEDQSVFTVKSGIMTFLKDTDLKKPFLEALEDVVRRASLLRYLSAQFINFVVLKNLENGSEIPNIMNNTGGLTRQLLRLHGLYVNVWLKERQVVLFKLKNHMCYALLARTDQDPLKTHTKPYVLHYIYTEPTERGRGYASMLLKHIKDKYQVTWFPENPDGTLFQHVGFYSVCNGAIYSADRQFELKDFALIVKTQARLRIVVFSSVTNRVASNGVFTGDNWVAPNVEDDPTITDDINTIWILNAGSSYYWIRSIGGYLREAKGNSGQKFCPLCFEWIRGRFEFHKCSAFTLRCYECGTTRFEYFNDLAEHRSKATHGTSECGKCGKFMASGECYDRHKCNSSYYIKSQHQCGKVYCKKCLMYYDKNAEHRCYMSRDKAFVDKMKKYTDLMKADNDDEFVVKEEENDGEDEDGDEESSMNSDSSELSKRDYHYAYDIECRLDDEPTGTGGLVRAIHHLCLIMVKPLYNDNAEVKTFYNLDDFFSWVFSKERGKWYDNRFLYEHLCTKLSQVPERCLWSGDKLMQFVVGGRKFNDSLCHIARSLSELPSMLGLKGEYAKGFFPHKFNTEANKDYVGPLSAKVYFEPEGMKPDRMREFEEWYTKEKIRMGDKWNLKTTLEKYCKSDVELLTEALEVYDSEMTELNGGLSPLCNATLASYTLRVYKNLRMPLNTICELKPEEYSFAKGAFRGGRTEVRCLNKKWSDEELESGRYGVYVDIQSMYPAVQYYNDMPCGIPRWHHYTKHNQPEERFLKKFIGFIKCDVKPAKYLHHPIVGTVDEKSKKYLFTMNELKQVTITSLELQVALKNGYEVSNVENILEFERKNVTFKEYVRKFLKIKVEATGFEGTDEEWERMKKRHKDELGIELDRLRMKKNKGRRAMAKLMLNSLWGKFGQRPDLQEDACYTKESYEKLVQAEVRGEVTIDSERTLPNGKIIVRSQKTNFIDNLSNKNVAIAAFVSAGGRIMLWETLNKLEERVFYHDTDSILYERDTKGYNVETGELLGEWADEHPGDKIVEFCGLGPKTYGFNTAGGHSVMKCKGFTMNSENDKKLTIEAYKQLVFGYVNGKQQLLETNATHFGYDKSQPTLFGYVNGKQQLLKTNATHFGYDKSQPTRFMFTQKRTKRLKVTAEKSAIDKTTLKTYPYGYINFVIMADIRTSLRLYNIGDVPHIEGRLIPPFVSPNVALPDQQVLILAQRIVAAAQHQFPDRRSGVMRMGVGVHQAHRYNLRVRAPDLAYFNYDQLLNNVETMVDSNDALELGDIVFLLVVTQKDFTYSENRTKKLKVTASKSAIERNTLKTYPFGYEQFGIELDEVE